MKPATGMPGGFVPIVAVKLTTNTAARFVYAFLPAIARGLGVSLSAAGVLASVRWGMGVTTPFVIRAAGTEHRRRVALTGLGLFVFGALVTAATGVFVGAMVGFALMGVAKPVFDTAAQAFVSDRVPYARRARTVGLIESTWAVSFLVGAPAAGWAIERWGWTAPFWAVGLVGAALVVPVARSFRSNAEVPVAAGGIRWDRSSIGFLTATVAVVGSVELVLITFAAWLETDFAFTVAGLAGVAFAIGCGELLAEGATVLFTDRLGKVRSVVAGLGLSVIAYLVMAGAASSQAAVASLVAGIAAFEFALVSSISLATELQRNARMAFLSRLVVAQATGRAVAAVAGVALYAAGGMAAVAVTAAATAAIAAVVILRSVRDHDFDGLATEEVR